MVRICDGPLAERLLDQNNPENIPIIRWVMGRLLEILFEDHGLSLEQMEAIARSIHEGRASSDDPWAYRYWQRCQQIVRYRTPEACCPPGSPLPFPDVTREAAWLILVWIEGMKREIKEESRAR